MTGIQNKPKRWRPRWSVGTLVLLLLSSSGCLTNSTQSPLINPSDAKSFPELHGVYRTECANNTTMYAHVGPAGDEYPDGFLRIILVIHPVDLDAAPGSLSVVGFVEQIGRYYVLHIPAPRTLKLGSPPDIWNQRWGVNEVSEYYVERLLLRPNGVETANLNGLFLAEQIDAKTLTGHVSEKDDATEVSRPTVRISANVQDLRQFFQRHIDGKLFEPSGEYTRVDKPSSP